MSKESYYKGPQCVYGKPCFAICTSPNCRKPGLICESGFYRQQCCLFHEECTKMKWSELQSLIYDNPNVRSTDFHYIKDKVDSMILNLINKIKTEHNKFKIWIKTYGYSIQVMKFIKNLTQNNFNQVTGNYINPIINEILSGKKVQVPEILQNQIVGLQQQLCDSIEKMGDLYLKPGTRKEKSLNSTSISDIKPALAAFNSKIIHDIGAVHRLFDAKINSLKLIFRASQNGYSIKEFHKKCDGLGGTLTVLETQFGKIIGGYTPIAWSSAKKQWAADKSLKSFIFSLNMREKFNLNLAQFAIANNPEKGPIFGCCDICIVDNANKERSNAQFPISYNNGKYIRSPQSSFAFTGHPKGQFLIKQWQVYKIQFD